MLWKAYETTTEEILPNALRVHDKFHISGYLNKAVDATRRKENRVFLKEGLKHLTGTKYLWLKGEWDEENRLLYEALIGVCVKTSRAWSIKEAFSCFWDYIYQGSAEYITRFPHIPG